MSDPNEKLYAALKELGDNFVGTPEHMRGLSYYKAIRGMKQWVIEHEKKGRLPGRFTDEEADMLVNSPAKGGAKDVGKKIGKKIKDWNATYDESTGVGRIGQLEKFREAEDPDEVFTHYNLKTATPEEKVIAALAKIPYVGTAKAKQILSQLPSKDPVKEFGTDGIIDALRRYLVGKDPTDTILDARQLTSLKYLDQTSKRMERSFVSLVGSCVAFIFEQAYGRQSPDTWTVTVGGSYYRGLKDSGDLDIILYVPSGEFTLAEGVRLLKRYGFVFEEFSHGTSKFLGLGKCGNTSGSEKVFKVDILYVKDPKEKTFALLHYTLGDVANRRLRQDAKEAGLKLEQTGLYANRGEVDATGNRIRIDLGENLHLLTPAELESRIMATIKNVNN